MEQKPNIILFITEQHRGDCLGIEGHPVLMTPNMDAIAGEGARFTHAYTPCPTCIAARRTILSGQFPETHGMVGYRENVPWEIKDTLPAVLAREGYETAWIGRSMHQYPACKKFGFETVVRLGGVPGPGNRYMRDVQLRHPDDWEGIFGTGVTNNDWTARPWHLEEDLHHTNWTIHEALRFLEERDTTRPFFLVVSLLAAHPPLLPPAFYLERYIRTGVPGPVIGDWAEPPPDSGKGLDVGGQRVDLKGEALLSARAGYYGLINHLDDQLRRILKKVRGIDYMTGGNVAVMLTSDHGEMLGDHYHWHKIMPYEPSARVPMLLRAPERFGIKPGTVMDQPVSLADVMPTILELAGAPIPPGVEGESLLPLLRGEDVSWREYLHIEHAPVYHALTDGREKYIWFAATGDEQFFDLTLDPSECRNLAGKPGESARVERWRNIMIRELAGRPEGFSNGKKLVPGRAYPAYMERRREKDGNSASFIHTCDILPHEQDSRR